MSTEKTEQQEEKEKQEKEQQEEKEKQEKEKQQKKLLLLHRIWRIINWVGVIWILNSALYKCLNWIGVLKEAKEIRIIVFMVSFLVAGIMVLFAEGTNHDKLRRNAGWIIVGISEGIMLLPAIKDVICIASMGFVNLVSNLIIGGKIFLIENYEKTDLGVFWIVNLILSVVICLSLLKEEQSTDKKLGFARTPQKKEVLDIMDSERKVAVSFEKYKR